MLFNTICLYKYSFVMKTFKDLKRNLKKNVSALPTIKVSLLGDTATQFLATTIRGEGNERGYNFELFEAEYNHCLLYTSPSPRDGLLSRMPSSA